MSKLKNGGLSFYEKKHGSYYLVKDIGGAEPQHLSMSDQVALYLHPGTGVLYRHGSPENVERYAADNQKSMINKSEYMREFALSLVVIVLPPDFDVEEINKCINISGYAGILFNKLTSGEE